MDEEERKKGLGQKDANLWQHMTSDVERMPGAEYKKARPDEPKPPPDPIPKTRAIPKIQKQEIPKNDTPNMGLDRRTDERLRRGQLPIEARLDLHGYRQHEAQEKLRTFIKNAQNSGKRCVLVITGKGGPRGQEQAQDWMDPDEFGPKSGVLRQNVPLWLTLEPMKALVLKTYPAQPKDGGAGALYVYLRKKR